MAARGTTAPAFRRGFWALAGLAVLWPGAATACRLALALALDVSSSVDPQEDRLQREGLAASLMDADVRAAILATPGDPVAVTVYEWSGRYRQVMIADWALLRSTAEIAALAAEIAGSDRSEDRRPTAMGYAIGYSAALFRDGPECLFRTLDVSGDGITNDGFGPDRAYRFFPLDGVTVNGLVVGDDPEVLRYYEDQVIRGPGAFVERAADYGDFARAMRRKLLREIAARAVGEAPLSAPSPAGRPAAPASGRDSPRTPAR